MLLRMRSTIWSGLFLLHASAWSQNLIPAMISGQSLVNARGGVVYACGIRMVAAPRAENSLPAALMFDVSLNLMQKAGGTAKLVAGHAQQVKGELSFKPIKIYGGWIKAVGSDPAPPTGPYTNGLSPPESLLYTAETLAAAKVIVAILGGSVAQIAIEDVRGTSKIYYGTVAFDGDAQEQFASCIKEL